MPHLNNLKAYWRKYRMPITIIFLGITSITLFIMIYWITEKLRFESNIVDLIMDAQIHAGLAHILLEQPSTGIKDNEVKKFLAETDQAIDLLRVSLDGGEAESGWISYPIVNPEQRTKIETLIEMLLDLKTIGVQWFDVHEEPDKAEMLHLKFNLSLFNFIQNTRDLEELLELEELKNVTDFRNLSIAIISIWTGLIALLTTNAARAEKTKRKAKQDLLLANERLMLQAQELEEHREHLASLVDQRTNELQQANKKYQIEMNQRLQTCQLLNQSEIHVRKLTERLLKAQEIERKRIAMELHDDLGASLNVVKLKLREAITLMDTDETSSRAACEYLVDYSNKIIENVRRISLNLSPTILDDLGLTAALHWLIDSIAKASKLKVDVNIIEIDHAIPRNHWMTIYRIAQEALNNILKHAKAKNIGIIISHTKNEANFLIEDDGQGFDPEAIATDAETEQTLGLQTMAERVKSVGGEFNLRSRKGQGTQIIFNVPVLQGAQ